MTNKYCKLFILVLFILFGNAIAFSQDDSRLMLPNLGQLPSPRVLCVIQDDEGFLWYGTEGGGVARDDGREMIVFRNDAEHPHLLGSNNIASLASAGRHIIIGTFHGAYVLDKNDYTIHRLSEVDDKRVDDVIVARDGHWWITANKKVYEYAPDCHFLNCYLAGDKYIFRLHADPHGRIWGAEWQGGLRLLADGQFKPVHWPLDVAPTNIVDSPTGKGLLIGTFGKGVVRYDPSAGEVELTQALDSFCMSVERLDNRKRKLVADGRGGCYVLSNVGEESWYRGQPQNVFIADSIRAARGLSQRPAAYAFDSCGHMWFSTGQDIRRQQQPSTPEEVVIPELPDISAMTFAPDGTLWLGSIFGTIQTYKDGRLSTDNYASNEYGDALLALQIDSLRRLLLVYERYVRLYDPQRHTLRQQSREAQGTYAVELSETQPHRRWSQPEDVVTERLPQWLTSWWMCGIYVFVIALLAALLTHYYILRRQRSRFLGSIRESVRPTATSTEEPTLPAQDAAPQPHSPEEKWLQKAIALVTQHIAEDTYGVEQLSSDLAMSRMTFYRKIQVATGQKPSEFIRTIRLRRAAQLLNQGQLSVTEISFQTGFTSVSYFSRCFRTMYGVPPTQFGKTTTADDRFPKEMPD